MRRRRVAQVVSEGLADVLLQLGHAQHVLEVLKFGFLGFVIFVQDRQALFEPLENPRAAACKFKHSPCFSHTRIQNVDLVFDRDDLLGNPAFGVLAVEEDVQ